MTAFFTARPRVRGPRTLPWGEMGSQSEPRLSVAISSLSAYGAPSFGLLLQSVWIRLLWHSVGKFCADRASHGSEQEPGARTAPNEHVGILWITAPLLQIADGTLNFKPEEDVLGLAG